MWLQAVFTMAGADHGPARGDDGARGMDAEVRNTGFGWRNRVARVR